MAAAGIELDLPSRTFRPLLFGLGAWTDHLHFGYDLVAQLRPKILVELGTDRGESYFCFCQAAAEQQTGTRCYAIDTWQGDTHAGGYDETTYRQVDEHNRQQYHGFSTLVRASFDEALARFADDSIDLLHIDGLHTEEAVRHDLERWLPKLRSGGVLLMHDVLVRRNGFGVWKVWAEISKKGESFTFELGAGLGVWKNEEISSAPVLRMLFAKPDETSNALLEYYRAQATGLHQSIAQQWRDGSIRQTAFAQQTIIQVFHSIDGCHREEDSVYARLGHEGWKEVAIFLPAGAGALPLRIDFVSAFTVIDLASLVLKSGAGTLFDAGTGPEFDTIVVTGDAQRHPHPAYLRLKITGIDPQLFLPRIVAGTEGTCLVLTMRLRVSAGEPPRV